MNLQFTHPHYLLLLAPALAWVIWLAWKSDTQASPWRRWAALSIRLVVLGALVLALAGLQWLRPVEGMNVFFALDRSDSIPSPQQEAARELVNRISSEKKKRDRAGVVVFGADASIESSPNLAVDLQKIYAVVGTERSDLAAAIRLATAAFPETGQKRLVLMSDGNENVGDALSAVLAAKPLGVSVDVVPMGVARVNDVSVQKLQVPAKLKEGQVFEVKIFVQADRATSANVRLHRDDQFLGGQKVELSAGKNLFTFPQTLTNPGFFKYDVQVDTPGDPLPQNNRATSFATVRGQPTILIVSADPDQDQQLAAALRSPTLTVRLVGLKDFPATLAEMQSYDALFISNLAAGDLGLDRQRLLESAVRDFGVGLVCVGGDQTYAAGGYRGTPLEATLPVSMELDSKKVLPSGAVVLVMHGMEFANGNEVARQCAQGVLATLGPTDEMGIVLWDGTERWLFPLQKAADKKALSAQIAGMNQGDLGSFAGVLQMAQGALNKSTSHLKHIIVFSDGDPAAPTPALMQSIVSDRITVSSVLISGHSPPDTMEAIAAQGNGQFYNVISPDDLPQIFIKETAVILKSAIYEEPFQPQVRAASEAVRGIGQAEYPKLLGYVATTPKPRAEIPLWTDKGDPLLAHWQYGLGRAVAFTSDAKARWARLWLNWEQYRQFWSQVGQWSMRRLENADFTTEVTADKGEGLINVEALDSEGNFRNFLNLQAAVVSPKGERQTVRLEQTGPGHYEARFPTKEVGAYLLNLMDVKDGQVRGSQVIGTSINYSPEFSAAAPNLNLLRRIAESGGGKLLDPAAPTVNPFLHDRQKTFQPRDLWESLLQLAIILFTLDVGVRRIQIDRDEWLRATQTLRRWLFFWRGAPRPPETQESLAALLARRHQVRSQYSAPAPEPSPDLFRPEQAPTVPLPGEAATAPPPSQPAGAPAQPSGPPEDQPASTASRLLAAKRRAQRRK
ncbi:MAG TPA: VWA domain-containing protein [Candidatus Paceibacterota bacterium]|nr:VWA domain-containing protein [Verrucomicrobiota bacterium]HSA08889.1 VWA domain-containing protein [Candidatus Paceibacterota bacterium]